MKIAEYAICFMMLITFISCGGGDDKVVDATNPTITLNSPTSSVAITPGGILNVSATLSDNVKLEEYVVKITPGGTKSVKNVEEFYFNSYTDLDAYGNALPLVAGEESVPLNFDIAIKDNARVGIYTFSLSVKDKSGNGAEEFVQFEIVRP